MLWVDRVAYVALAVVLLMAIAYFNYNDSVAGNMYVYLGIVPLLAYSVIRLLYRRRT